MEKLFENIDKKKEYKITFKHDETPFYGFITDIDSTFIYLEYPDKNTVVFHKTEILSIRQSKGKRSDSQ